MFSASLRGPIRFALLGVAVFTIGGGLGCAPADEQGGETAQAVVSSRTVAAWKFAEPSGDVVADASGNGNTAQLVGDATLQGGMLRVSGGGFAFVPPSDTLNAPVRNNQISVELWVWIPANAPADQVFVSRADDGARTNVALGIRGNQPFAQVGPGSDARATAPLALTRDTYHHLAFTYDGISINLYVDGTAQALLDVGYPLDSSTYPVLIGAELNGSDLINVADAFIDDVFVHDAVLSSSEF